MYRYIYIYINIYIYKGRGRNTGKQADLKIDIWIDWSMNGWIKRIGALVDIEGNENHHVMVWFGYNVNAALFLKILRMICLLLRSWPYKIKLVKYTKSNLPSIWFICGAGQWSFCHTAGNKNKCSVYLLSKARHYIVIHINFNIPRFTHPCNLSLPPYTYTYIHTLINTHAHTRTHTHTHTHTGQLANHGLGTRRKHTTTIRQKR